jgi:hypothetical protein
MFDKKFFIKLKHRSKRYVRGVIWVLLMLAPGLVSAGWLAPGDEIAVQTNISNFHYQYNPEHRKYSPLIGVELRQANHWLYGGALFINSFGQFSQTIYGGYLQPFGHSGFYGKFVAGLLHGYTGKYQHKVPLNYGGFSPIAYPAIGYGHGPWRAEAQLFWTNGVMFTAGFVFH